MCCFSSWSGVVSSLQPGRSKLRNMGGRFAARTLEGRENIPLCRARDFCVSTAPTDTISKCMLLTRGACKWQQLPSQKYVHVLYKRETLARFLHVHVHIIWRFGKFGMDHQIKLINWTKCMHGTSMTVAFRSPNLILANANGARAISSYLMLAKVTRYTVNKCISLFITCIYSW